MVFKIRVQTVDGDVDYYDVNTYTCSVCGPSLVVSNFFLESRYCPEYRLIDLKVTFVKCKVGD